MKLGEKQTLTVVKQVDFGVYLAEQPEDETRVLLPAKQVPEGTKLHDKLEVFLYKDSKDRLIATTNEPKLTLGGFAVLKVLQVTKIGAFLDWGLEKDLLLPFKEQLRKVHEGDEVLVTLYIDKSNRHLCHHGRHLPSAFYRLSLQKGRYRNRSCLRIQRELWYFCCRRRQIFCPYPGIRKYNDIKDRRYH